MKLSIVIPVYNVEDYLKECLDSCVFQDYPASDYEIIIVNDGSPDNSFAIIKEYETNYGNIKIVDKENGGLSSARNAGYRIASGEYIWFVDSDDWIKKNCLSQVVEFTNHSPDIIVLNTIIHEDDCETTKKRMLMDRHFYNGEDVYLRSWEYPYSAVQFYVFKKKFLEHNGLLFKEGIVFEDLLYMSEALSVAKTCTVISDPLYYYRIRGNSITSSGISEKKLLDLFDVMDSQNQWMHNCQGCNKLIMSDAICKTANNLLRYFIPKRPRRERKRWHKELNQRSYWEDCVTLSKRKKNRIFFIYNRVMVIFPLFMDY